MPAVEGIDPAATRTIYILNDIETRATADGRVFYVDHNRKCLSWTKPDQSGASLHLPSGWEARATEEGRVYYVNHTTRTSSWLRPLPASETYSLPEGWPNSGSPGEPPDELQELDLEITRCRLNLWREWPTLADCLSKRYALQGQATELDERIADDLAALSSAIISGSSLGSYAWKVNSLASSFIERWQAWKSPKDYLRSAYFHRLSLSIFPLRYGHLRTIIRLQMALSTLYWSAQSADVRMLNLACVQAEAGLTMDSYHETARPEHMHIVAYILRQRYLQLQNLSDLDRSIELSRRASASKSGTTGPYGDYENLAFSLWLRHNNLREKEDLDQAIAVYTQGLQNQVYSAEAFARRVKMLTAMLRKRYGILFDTSDLRKSVSLLGGAIMRLSPTSAKLADLCSDAVSDLSTCFTVDSKTIYFEEALAFAHIGLQQQNLSSERAHELLLMVGKIWGRRYVDSGSLPDQQRAIRYFEDALAVSGNDNYSRTTAWQMIGSIYESAYTITSDQVYLQLALESSAAGLRTADYQSTWLAYSSAARCQVLKFERDPKDLAALSKAIVFIEMALEAVKRGNSPNKATVWHRAGSIYSLKFQLSRDPEDFTTSLTLLLSCWYVKQAGIVLRISSVKLAGTLLGSVGRWRCAWKYLSEAIQFVSNSFPTHLNRQETLELAKALSGLASDACAAGLAIGETGAALEHLEQGRGLLVSFTYRASGEIGNLQAEHPPLYDALMQLKKLAFKENVRGSQARPTVGSSLDIEMERVTGNEALKKGVEIIRKQRGYERFLLPLRASDMQKLAGDGAIVVINSTGTRNDAIIVTKYDIKALQLPEFPDTPPWNTKLEVFSGSVIDRIAHQSATDESLNKSIQNRLLALVLEHLWQYLVCPVLDALQYTKERLRNSLAQQCVGKSRIWWMVTGNLSRLPLHAAGMWLQKPSENILQRAVSSYVTTFRMLSYIKQRSSRKDISEETGLFVSMARPNSTNRSKIFLKTAEDEEKKVKAANPAINWKSFTRKSAAELLEELPKHSFVHIATHGKSDPKDPSQSHLVLMRLQAASDPGCNSVPVRDNLTVSDIHNHDSAGHNSVLAFLAACSTADSKAQRLGDEGLQISNAFHLAGFPHVIASLWPANEFICPNFAERFYTYMKEFSGIPMNDRIALAHFNALLGTLLSDFQNLRLEPLLWAGFVHMGP